MERRFTDGRNKINYCINLRMDKISNLYFLLMQNGFQSFNCFLYSEGFLPVIALKNLLKLVRLLYPH